MPAQNKRLILTFIILTVLLAYSVAFASGIEEKITPELREKSISSPDEYARVIIKMKNAPVEKASSAKSGVLKKIQVSANAESLMKNSRVLKTAHDGSELVVAEMQLSDLDALATDVNVEYVEEDMPVHAFLSESVPLIGANSIWSEQLFDENITGAGTTVCIIDTGVDYTHTDLGGGWDNKVVAGYNAITDTDCSLNNAACFDDNGHGTHVAGIVAANGTIKGVAPDAKIVTIKALNSVGSGDGSDVAKGIDWCVSNSTKFNISVISMSLGTLDLHYASYCDGSGLNNELFSDAINAATAKNISVVIATGNEDKTNAISSPACIQNATRVGATTKPSETIAYFTNRGIGFPDMILAPGIGINSTYTSPQYKIDSGTSMSTPHVSGAIALLSQEHRKIYGTSETPQYFKSILNSTGKRIYDSGTGIYFSRINVSAAYNLILSNVPAVLITINAPQNGSFANVNYSIINASQTSSSEMNFSVDSIENKSACSSCSSFTSSTGDLADGLHNVTVYGSNILGAISHTTTYFTIDTLPPKIEFVNFTEENNIILDLSWIYANVSVTDANFKNITFSLDDKAQVISSTYTDDTRSVNWTNLEDGTYSFNATAYDAAGNMNYTETRMITLDTTKPHIEIITPKNTTYNSASRTLNYTATDKNLDAAWYEYNGTNRTLASGQTELNPSFTALDNQQSTLTLYANDTLGHINSTSVTFTVDTIYPQIYFIGTETNNSYWNRTWIYANISLTDANFKNLTLSLYNTQVSSSTYTDDTRSVNWTNLEDGTYSFNATAYDAAGNMNYTETQTITLDTTNPTITFVNITPDNNSTTNNWAYINITSNEPLSSALLEWNDIAPNLTMQGLGKNWYINKTQLTNGNYTFRVYANDTSGKWNNTETRTIFAACTESWSYSAWSACSGGTQARTATDANTCGTMINQSALIQSCTSATPHSSGSGGFGGGIIIKEKNITNNTANSTNVSISFKANEMNSSIAENAPLKAKDNSSIMENNRSNKAAGAPKIDANQKENKGVSENTAPGIPTALLTKNYLEQFVNILNYLIRYLLGI